MFFIILFYFFFNKIIFCDASIDWQLGMQEPFTPVAEGIICFHNYLMFFIVFICFLVFYLLFYIIKIFSFYILNSLKPSSFTDFNLLEIVWTLFPAVILLLLGWIGQKPVESPFIKIGVGCTIFYFVFFLILLLLSGKIEKYLIYYKIEK